MRFDETSYWMVTGQWVALIAPQTQLATPENPNPQQRPMAIPLLRTEFINMHPARYTLMVQAERPNYALIDHLQITREAFELVSKIAASSSNGSGVVEHENGEAASDAAIEDIEEIN